MAKQILSNDVETGAPELLSALSCAEHVVLVRENQVAPDCCQVSMLSRAAALRLADALIQAALVSEGKVMNSAALAHALEAETNQRQAKVTREKRVETWVNNWLIGQGYKTCG